MRDIKKVKQNAVDTLLGSDAEEFYVFIRLTDGRWYKTAVGTPDFLVMAGATATHLGMREYMSTEQIIPTLEKQ